LVYRPVSLPASGFLVVKFVCAPLAIGPVVVRAQTPQLAWRLIGRAKGWRLRAPVDCHYCTDRAPQPGNEGSMFEQRNPKLGVQRLGDSELLFMKIKFAERG
jgi:hypothetical protein